MPLFADLSDPVLIAIVAGAVSVFLTFLTTVGGLITLYVQMRMDRKKTEQEMASVQQNVQKIETATNSMKDALVLATEKEALARGIKEGTETRAKAERDKSG